MSIHLLTQIFKDDSAPRNAEINHCFSQNSQNPLLSDITLFTNEHGYVTDHGDKIKIVALGERLTFKHCLEYASQNFPGEICVIANVDIYFDDTLQHLNTKQLEGKMLALSRYEFVDGKTTLYGYPYNSQDVWIFIPPTSIEADFQLGQLGCDNLFAHEAERSGLTVINPSLLIKCTHMHATRKINYSTAGTIPPPYKTDLTAVNDY